MKYGKCPKCGGKKHQLMACSNCSYMARSGIRRKPVRPESEKAPDKKRARAKLSRQNEAKAARKAETLKMQEKAIQKKRVEMAERAERAKQAEKQRHHNFNLYWTKDRIKERNEKDRDQKRIIGQYLKKNPIYIGMGKFGVPQDKHRYGEYGHKTMEYDVWRLGDKEK